MDTLEAHRRTNKELLNDLVKSEAKFSALRIAVIGVIRQLDKGEEVTTSTTQECKNNMKDCSYLLMQALIDKETEK